MQKALHFFGRRSDGVNVQLVLSGYAVDLGDDILLIQYIRHLRQTFRRCFDFKIAGRRAADLLRIDDGCIFLDNPFLLQRLYPGLHRNPGYADPLTNIGIGNARVLYQQPHDFLIRFVQPV